ncbi:Alpha/Beta hydrolase protein [Clohesyomyces aquaticus]|uniref:Alpha/Beta hydrolase protein n=1 Tax=Clohesyomyces aquaticus TaxID=1231657 RepID=A0A1Y1YPN3_9PLEO|nr:Alpha/Beta hydrolase protein [Clohesyomyces aquaticus]
MAQHKGNRPRWMLHLQAQVWRILMGIGMQLHRLARPLPPSPSFHRYIEATVSPLKGKFRLQFYVPKDYHSRKRLKGGKRYPCVINFHGGGFTLGTAKDDSRWAGCVVDKVGAVVVSVDYRLAPEFPFPTAVEDGADAVLWLAQHADELLLDPERFAVSGFSSGGNMSFTVPLCLQGELNTEDAKSGAGAGHGLDRGPEGEGEHRGSVPTQAHLLAPPQTTTTTTNTASNAALLRPGTSSTNAPTPTGSRIALTRQKSRLDRIAVLRQTGVSSLSLISSYKDGPSVSVLTSSSPLLKIRGIISFYPSTDYTQTREQRRQTCSRTDQQLPAVFTELFDDSYLQPPSLDLAHPWLSPGVAPEKMLRVLPDDVVLFTCEWDMLLAEGERLRDRLEKELGKRVAYHMVPGVPHGWDKAPNPIRESPGARQQYEVACRELRRMFDVDEEGEGEGDEGGD